MVQLSTFIIEVCLSLTVSILTLLLLKSALQAVLLDLCQGEQRAEFWGRFTQLMLIIGPLLGVLLFIQDASYAEAINTAVFRETLKHALMGGFFTLCGVAFIIWRTIPATDITSQSTSAKHLSPANNKARS